MKAFLKSIRTRQLLVFEGFLKLLFQFTKKFNRYICGTLVTFNLLLDFNYRSKRPKCNF